MSVAIVFSTGIFTGCQTTESGNPSSSISAPSLPNVSSAEVARVTSIKEMHEDQMFSNPSIVGIGVGPAIATTKGGNTMGVNQAAVWIFTDKQDAEDLPSEIEGVPTHIEYVGEVRALQFTGTYRTPMWSGVSVGNDNECASGTIGCVVKDASNNMYLLSNNHVFARENSARIGEKIDQPGRYDMSCGPSGQVGTLSRFVKITMKRNANNQVDCALANISSGISWTSQMAQSSYTPTANAKNATVGMTVKKTGRTTGLTGGTVSAVNVTVNVQYSHGTARFINQVYVTPGTFSAAGDSGSLIVEASSNDPVALLFAGGSTGTFGNPITSVLGQLGVSVVPF
jgi:hypothetical protein